MEKKNVMEYKFIVSVPKDIWQQEEKEEGEGEEEEKATWMTHETSLDCLSQLLR